MPNASTGWTVERVRALIDESRNWPRYELVEGELLVTPAPRPVHQIAVTSFLVRLHPYVTAQSLGMLLTSPADIGLEPQSLVQPDVFVVPPDTWSPSRQWSDVRSLRLAVEILSPGSVRHDRTVKRRLYQRAGVAEYWIVDLDARRVERWRPGDEHPDVLDELLEWRLDPTRPALEIDLPALFAEVLVG